jgi:aqualysin 1
VPLQDATLVILGKRGSSPARPSAEAANAILGTGGQLHHIYSAALKGFAASLPEAAVQSLRNNPAVDYVEQDQSVSLSQVESGATWGLDRIDQADRPLDTLYHFNYTGAGVTAFIIDTGIRSDHSEFGGRVLSGDRYSKPLIKARLLV